MVKVPPCKIILSDRGPKVLAQLRDGAGCPPVVTHTNVMASPGFTTIGSSTKSLIDGDAKRHKQKKTCTYLDLLQQECNSILYIYSNN